MPGTIYDYFIRACQRRVPPEAERGLPGGIMTGRGGNRARFWLDVCDGRIRAVYYAATSCTTLLAACQHVSELAAGQDLLSLSKLGAAEIAALHPEVAPSKRDSIALAVEAFQAALAASVAAYSGVSDSRSFAAEEQLH